MLSVARRHWQDSARSWQMRHQADARLRAQPYCPRPSLGEDPSRVLRRREQHCTGGSAAKLHAGRDRPRAQNTGVWSRSQFPGLAGHAAAQLCQSRAADRTDRRTDRDRRQMRRRALRHGNAAVARDFPAHLGNHARAVLAASDGSGPGEISRLHLHGGGVLGSRMDIAAAGLRLLLRQAAQRSAEGGRGKTNPRPPAGRPRLSGQARALSENHDEPRAAAEFSWPQHAAAAVITYLSPGLRFFHQGQFEGALIRVPVHLCRGPVEPTDSAIADFYGSLLQVMKQIDALRSGTWSQIDPQPAWPGNGSASNFIAFAWAGELGRYLVVANYANSQGQCRLPLPFSDLSGKQLRLTDLMGTEIYDRAGSDLAENGLYIDHAPWHRNVFELRTL